MQNEFLTTPLDIYMVWIEIIFVTLIGLTFGSFATAAAHRIPRNKSFVSGRSICPSCKNHLGVLDLFPVFSWLFLRGACRHCRNKISACYPLTELTVAILFVLIYQQLGITVPAFIVALLALCLVIMTIIDLKFFIIPDGLNLFMLALGIAYQFSVGSSWQFIVTGPLVGLAVGLGLRWFAFGFIWLLHGQKREALGLGDVKFLVVVGSFIWFAPLTISTYFFIAGMVGVFTAVVLRLRRFPFGPALAVALFVCLLYPEFISWWVQTLNNWMLGWIS